MCGIFAYVIFKGGVGTCKLCGCTCASKGSSRSIEFRRSELIECARRIRHRGPDWTGNFSDSNASISIFMIHERLSIIDPFGGSQPLTHDLPNGEKIVLCINGEIYNHQEIRKKTPDFPYTTQSDCEVILSLYMNNRDSLQGLFDELDGQFAFILYDSERKRIVISRDPIGICSLYYATHVSDGSLAVASELKAIPSEFENAEQFPPGTYIEVSNEIGNWKNVDYYSNSAKGAWKMKYLSKVGNVINNDKALDEEAVYSQIRALLTAAVKKRLMSDVPFGLLMSGGLDSSLVCSIAVKLMAETKEAAPWTSKLHTFAIGLEGSPDLAKAKELAEFLGTYHYSFKFTLQEGLDAIRDVVYQLETYDVTTIRASTPMYLLARRIKSTGVKMVLSGEGSDEILGGYLYFLKAPDDEEFNRECHRRTSNLHKSDCLRADKSAMAWGVEGRFPFLDNDFISYAIDLPPSLKRKNNIEKYVLRKAFDVKVGEDEKPMYLPSSILWRQKEQFSDGVGYGWIGKLVEQANEKYTDEEFVSIRRKYLINPPGTKEALFYREIFESFYPKNANTVDYWVPRTDWPEVGADPSGRAQKVHEQAI